VQLPRPAVVLAEAVDDTDLVERLLRTCGPYWPVQRYVSNDAEYAALSGGNPDATMPVGPVFRGNWALHDEVLPGVEPLLHNAAFVEGARQLFGASVVRPTTVYVNLTHQLPFSQGAGHTDVPAFRGFDRSTVPITFLTLMGQSGLFEDVRVKVATAVSWFYRGSDGGFEYWPVGPDQPSVLHEGDIWNTALVADNDFMWHRARPVGRMEDGLSLISLDSELVARDEDQWAIVTDGVDTQRFGRERLRVSLSWKAVVFADEAEERAFDDHTADITPEQVLTRFADDLSARGRSVTPGSDPWTDPVFIDVLREEYVRLPVTA
jgi:hypothetical protein